MKKGFTLIELLVVVLIIGILSAVALPQYTKAVEKARMSNAISVLSSIYKAQQVYYLANNQYAQKLDDLDVGVTGEDVDAVGDGVVAFGPLKKTQDFIFGAWTMTVNVPGMASTSRIDANGHVAYVMMMTMGGTRFCNASAYATDAQSKLCADWRDGKI